MQRRVWVGRGAGLPGAAGGAAAAVSRIFSEDRRFCFEGKGEKEMCREVRHLAEPTQVPTQACEGNTDPHVSEVNGKHSAFY